MKFRAGLIGRDIGESLSPVCHSDIFEILRDRIHTPYSQIEYTLEECRSNEEFENKIYHLRDTGVGGLNITAPFKSAASAVTTFNIKDVYFTHAVNTVRITNNYLIGAGTDGAGFVSSIRREYLSFNLEHYDLICIGAGDTARAVLFALCTYWMPRTLTIINRTRSHAESLASFIIANAPGPSVEIRHPDDRILPSISSTHRFFIQCTSTVDETALPQSISTHKWDSTDIVYDVLYRPLLTPIQKLASEGTEHRFNGLGMLIDQAAIAQYYWLTGELLDISPLNDDDYFRLKQKYTLLLS